MKANSSGNRVTGHTHHEHEDEREGDLVTGVRESERRAYARELFVHHQQELARRALHLGSPGAARAALRALYAVDFADTHVARDLLQVLRDPMSPQDEVMVALRGLVQLEPFTTGRPRISTEQFFTLDRSEVPQNDD